LIDLRLPDQTWLESDLSCNEWKKTFSHEHNGDGLRLALTLHHSIPQLVATVANNYPGF
jgi:hypothetical protein